MHELAGRLDKGGHCKAVCTERRMEEVFSLRGGVSSGAFARRAPSMMLAAELMWRMGQFSQKLRPLVQIEGQG